MVIGESLDYSRRTDNVHHLQKPDDWGEPTHHVHQLSESTCNRSINVNACSQLRFDMLLIKRMCYVMLTST